LLSGICCQSVVVCNTPQRRICNVTHQMAARDGGPVVLRPVRATPCLNYLYYKIALSHGSHAIGQSRWAAATRWRSEGARRTGGCLRSGLTHAVFPLKAKSVSRPGRRGFQFSAFGDAKALKYGRPQPMTILYQHPYRRLLLCIA